MVIASAGHTASHSLQAMQRSSPLGYRRSACRPRKRGDCGVFSIGYISVYLGRNRYVPVSIRPWASSMSSRLLKKETTRVISSLPRREHVVVHQQRRHEDPGDGDGNEDLPAQPHDLVVAVAREGRTEPDEATGEEADLQQQPPPAVDRQQRDAEAMERAEPAAHEEDRDEEADQQHVRVFGQEEQRELRTGVF